MEISRRRKIIKIALISLVVLVIAGIFARIAIWEYHYYKEKTGKIRTEPASFSDNLVEEEQEISTKKPTESEINAHTVSANQPRFLSIPKINVHRARVVSVGVKENGQMDTPNNNYDIGWFHTSGLPGFGGTMLMNGHSGTNIPGVFKNLPQVQKGDLIKVERGDGSSFEYVVYDSKTIHLDQANKHMQNMIISPILGEESLSLISCTGTWSQARRTYLSRQFVRAIKR